MSLISLYSIAYLKDDTDSPAYDPAIKKETTGDMKTNQKEKPENG